MAYKRQSKTASKKEEPKQEKVAENHKCELCEEQAVVRDDGIYYCTEHHFLWCESVSHEHTAERVKRGEGCKSILNNRVKRT